MIRVTYTSCGERSYTWTQEVGAFNNAKEAKGALSGLCPWDFDAMYGAGDYREFQFTEAPGRLSPNQDAKVIRARDLQIAMAREHADQWKGSWHSRAPKDWGTKESG